MHYGHGLTLLLPLLAALGCGGKDPGWCDTGFGRADDGNCYRLKTCEEDEILGVDGNCYPMVAGDSDVDADTDTDTDTDSDTDTDTDTDSDTDTDTDTDSDTDTDTDSDTDTDTDTGTDTGTDVSCDSTHEKVGWVAILEAPPDHPFAPTGTATILDDCRIEIVEFTFDGLGDETYFWAAQTGAMEDGFIISGRLDGEGEFTGATLELRLPPERSLDEMDLIAVYDVIGESAFSEGVFIAP